MKSKNETQNPQTVKHRWWIPAGLGMAAIIILIIIYFISSLSKKTVTGKGKDLNLLVITLDTTRADRIGAYGYKPAQTPNLDQLANRGILFENCYSPVPLTLPAHCAIFTGKYPLGHRVRDNGTYYLEDNQVTLAEKMKELGRQTYAVIASYVLLSKFGLKQGFDVYDDALKINEMVTDFDSEIDAQQVYTNFNRWLSRETGKKQKENQPFSFFAWIHFYDPHLPYNPPTPYKEKFGPHPEGQYSGELAYVDDNIGKVIESLKTAGLLEKTLVVVVGDHGEAFGEHLEYGHSIFCYEETLRVPLIFYNTTLFPRAQRIPQRVNIIDIMPTLLEMVGLDIPPEIQGTSFVDLIQGEKEKKQRTYYIESMHGKEENGWAPLTGIITDQYKYISLPEPELYDLTTDPLEKDNLFWKKNRLARTLDDRLLEMVKNYSTAAGTGGSQRQLTEDDKKHLQTLGYISAFDNPDKAAANVDPKKGIALDSRLTQIEIAIKQEKLDEAEAQLKDLAEKNPQIHLPQYFGLLKTIYEKKNDMEGVIRTWRQAIETFPTNSNFKINLAFQFFQLNRLDEAEILGKQILAENAQYTKTYILLGRIREREEQIPEALAYFEKAYTLEPQNAALKISYAKILGRSSRFTQAAEICEELLANEDVNADPSLKNRIGIVLTEIRKDDLAFKVLTEVKDADKADAETWNYLGILYFRQQQFDKASAAYVKSIELDPKIAKTYNNLGTLYLTAFSQKKDPQLRDMAMKAFNKALELEPALISALNGRAAAYKFNNQAREALNDWKKIIAHQPNYIDAYFNIGVTLLELNAKKEALEYLKIAREKFYNQLPPGEQQRLDRLINSAGG